MTILQLIIAACVAAGVPEKFAERIQKTFKIEKEESIEGCVALFKENILPAISEAEQAAQADAKAAAIVEYERTPPPLNSWRQSGYGASWGAGCATTAINPLRRTR